MAQKMMFFSTNILAKILQHILGCRFCADCHILAHFCQTLLPFKASKFICAKAAPLWH
jgi:hypothetical protein